MMINYVVTKQQLPARDSSSRVALRSASIVVLRNLTISCVVALSVVSGTRVSSGQGRIAYLRDVEGKGIIKAVRPGVLVVQDPAGQVVEYKIQETNEPGVSLGGARAVIDFPAKVELSGALSAASLQRGASVRLAARLNRQGRTEGLVNEISVIDHQKDARGVEVNQTPSNPSQFTDCIVTGEVHSYRSGRLVVAVPKSDFVRKSKLTLRLSDDLQVLMDSKDYRRAKAGDEVEKLVASLFSSGDFVIKEVSIKIVGGLQPRLHHEIDELVKYRRFSDEPGEPRDVRSAHFVLHTDVSERSARILLDKLETMIRLVSQYYRAPPAGIIEAYVVRDLSLWPSEIFPEEAIAKIKEPAGVTISLSLKSATMRQTRSMVYSCDKHSTVQHEAIHAYCAQTFGSTGPVFR